MSDKPIASSLLRQEGPQQEELHDQLIAADALIASMKRALQGWLDANAPGGWIDDLRQAAHTRLTDLAAAQARIEVLEGSIDYLRNVIDHPVTQEVGITNLPICQSSHPVPPAEGEK